MRDEGGVETAVVDALVAGTRSCASLPDAELIVVFDELAARRRQLDAALAAAVGEIAARSEGVPAEASLVRRAGHRHVREMVQHRVGLRAREAAVRCAVADATRSTVALSGGVVPAAFPRVGEALSAGWIAVAQAHAITDTLGRSASRVSVDGLSEAEQWLVGRAVGVDDGQGAADGVPMTPEVLAGLARHCLDHLDPDGAEPRYDEIVAGRYFRMRRLRDGSLRGESTCAPDVGDAIQAVFDAEVRPRRVTFDGACGDDDQQAETSTEVDERTPDQRRMDVLAAIVAHHGAAGALKVCDEAPALTITVSADALRGEPTSLDDQPRLDRSGEPVPVAVAAALLCDAFVQTVMHDEACEPLRLGRRRRLFSRAQRRAIIARDQRCRAPGCTAPPGWCETHHVAWWSNGGGTDVDNGILLCRFHHTEVHRGALVIEPASPNPVDAVRDASAEPPTTRDRRAPRRWRVVALHRRRPRTRTPMRR